MDQDERIRITVELQSVLADFWHDVDTNWGRRAAEFYTEEGVFEASERTYVGRDMIDRFYRYRQDRGPRVAAHTFANFRAEPASPTEAVCTWYLLLYAADGVPVLPTTPPIMVALATDHCVKCKDGRWRYRHRKFETWFKGGVPTTTMTAEYDGPTLATAQGKDAYSTKPVEVAGEDLSRLIAGLFRATGLSAGAATRMGDALVEADLEGLPSHGVMQAEVYLRRLVAGGTTTRETAEIVHDAGAVVVLDAHDMLGHLSAEQAMALACARAADHGVGAVAVRNAFHFGAAGRYARQAAAAGCVGIVMCNSRPVMPAPGGAQMLVGTNPLAIALPTESDPIVLDMATSAGTVARLRLAANAGKPIPEGWAVDAEGQPTTDAEVALKGMLLPMGGAKGFALSFVIDLISGLLSSGAWGDGVRGMHVGPDVPAAFSHFFLALHVDHFRPLAGFRAEAASAAERVRTSRRAPETERLYVPGERKVEALRNSNGRLVVAPTQVVALRRLATELGVDPAPLGPG